MIEVIWEENPRWKKSARKLINEEIKREIVEILQRHEKDIRVLQGLVSLLNDAADHRSVLNGWKEHFYLYLFVDFGFPDPLTGEGTFFLWIPDDSLPPSVMFESENVYAEKRGAVHSLPICDVILKDEEDEKGDDG